MALPPRRTYCLISLSILTITVFFFTYTLYKDFSLLNPIKKALHYQDTAEISLRPQEVQFIRHSNFSQPTLENGKLSSAISKSSQCKLLTTYDEELRPLANRGYNFLRSAKCEFKNLKPKPGLEEISAADCRHPYVLIDASGRLGNTICEYLMAESLKKMFNVGVAISQKLNEYLEKYFTEFEIKPAKRSCHDVMKLTNIESITNLLRENMSCPGKIPVNNMKTSFNISWYPCKMDILMDNRKDLSQKIKFKPKILEEARTKLEKTLKTGNFSRENNTIISIHVRRTDYEYRLRQVFNRRFLTVCYYQQAMHHFRLMFKNVVFVVASDDLGWSKENLSGVDVVFLDHKEAPIIDMAAMSLCDHHIVGYGTFGFFGAYLSGSGYIIHHFVVNGKLTEFEQEFLCSESEDLIAVPDMGIIK